MLYWSSRLQLVFSPHGGAMIRSFSAVPFPAVFSATVFASFPPFDAPSRCATLRVSTIRDHPIAVSANVTLYASNRFVRVGGIEALVSSIRRNILFETNGTVDEGARFGSGLTVDGSRLVDVSSREGRRTCRWGSRDFSSGTRSTLAGIKNPYWRHKGFWEWRRREITQINRSRRRRRHIFPIKKLRYQAEDSCEGHKPNSTDEAVVTNMKCGGALIKSRSRRVSDMVRTPQRTRTFLHLGDENPSYVEDERFASPPKKGCGRVWIKMKSEIPLGRKRLLLYCRLIKGLNITDAIDYLSSLGIHRCNYLLNFLSDCRRQIHEEKCDVNRVYIESYMINGNGHVKTMRVGYHYRVNFLKSWRYTVVLKLREIPVHEFFHRLFILKRIPRSLAQDMRFAVSQSRVPVETSRDWYPYIDAHTRFWHRQRLKYLNRTRLFNYHLARRAFEDTYMINTERMHIEDAEVRGITVDHLQISPSQKTS